MKIEGCIALVTGANRGLGKAIVTALVEAGAAKVYAAARDGNRIGDQGVKVVPLTLDTTHPGQLAQAVNQAGDVSLLINNAGVLSSFDVMTMTPVQFEGDFRTNVHCTLEMIKAFLPTLERTRGATIVNVLSLAAFASVPSMGGGRCDPPELMERFAHVVGSRWLRLRAGCRCARSGANDDLPRQRREFVPHDPVCKLRDAEEIRGDPKGVMADVAREPDGEVLR